MKFSVAPLMVFVGLVASSPVVPVHADANTDQSLSDTSQALPLASQARELATDLVEDVVNQLATLARRNPSPILLNRQVGALLDQKFDLHSMRNYALGRYRNRATAAQLKEYDQLFKQVMINNYVRLLGSHTGQKLEVKRCDIRQGKAIVSSQLIQFPGSMPLGIQWVLRWTGGGFRIIDVNIQGISMATSQRSEFTSILAQNNGSIEALLKVLRQRVAPTPSINQS